MTISPRVVTAASSRMVYRCVASWIASATRHFRSMRIRAAASALSPGLEKARPLGRTLARASGISVPTLSVAHIHVQVMKLPRIGADAAVPVAIQVCKHVAIFSRCRMEIDGATSGMQARMARAGDASARTMRRNDTNGAVATLDRGEDVFERSRQARATGRSDGLAARCREFSGCMGCDLRACCHRRRIARRGSGNV